MSQIIYAGPPIADDVHWNVRHHLQLIYQRLGIINQAFELQNDNIAAVKAENTSTTTTINQSGGSGNTTPAPKGVLVGTGAAAIVGVPSVSPGYILTDDGSGMPPGFKFPFTSLPQYKYANLPGSPTLGQCVCVTDSTVNTWGTFIVIGGGAYRVGAWWNSMQWSVFAI